MNTKKLVTFCSLFLAFSLLAFPVAKDGRPQADILIGTDVPPAIKTAALDLQKWLGKITGAEFRIVTENDEGTAVIILSDDEGILAEFPEVPEALQDNEGCAVRCRDNRLYVLGSCPKGVLTGVSRLLTRNTDLIWLRPDAEYGTVYTMSPSLDFTDVSFIDVPKFKMSGWQFPYNMSFEEVEWTVHHGGNWTSYAAGNHPVLETYALFQEACFGHNLVGTYIKPSKYLETHPEYYPLIDGQRVNPTSKPYLTQLCFTNQEMIQDFIREFDAQIELQPGRSMYGVFAEDNYDQCQCENCQADIILPDGSVLTHDAKNFYSTRFFQFLNQVAAHEKEVHPDIKVSTYAYFFTEIPPAIPVEDNIVIVSCPIYKNVKFPVTDPKNTFSLERLNGWLEKTPNILIYEYFGLTGDYPRPADDAFAQDLRYLLKHGVNLGHSEIWTDSMAEERHYGAYIWDSNEIYFWVMAQLFWDPEQDVETLRNEALKRAFGPAAADIRQYLSCTEKAWRSTDEVSVWNTRGTRSWQALVELGLDAKCRECLEAAGRKDLNPTSRILLERMTAIFEKNTVRPGETAE